MAYTEVRKEEVTIMSTVGQRVKEKRLELGMTQDALARAAGYHSRSTINKIESGERNLSFPRIAELADALGVTPDYLLGVESLSPDSMEAKIGTALYQACGDMKKKEIKELIRYARDHKLGKKNR
jgi:transcriptional regulator with XRE-family HTH domain